MRWWSSLPLLFALAAGCATTGNAAGGSSPPPAETSLLEPPATAEREPLPPVQTPAAPIAAGTIPRVELERFLAQPPGLFLSRVETSAHFRGRRFRGWRIHAFFSGDPRFAAVDLRAGDVVTRVNGRSVEHPEQFLEVWRGARARRDLTVDVLRGEAPRTLSWQIVD